MKKLLIALLVIALAVGGYFGYRRYQQAQAAAQNTYQLATLTRGELTAQIGATGTVRANQSAVLVWQATGRVDQVNIKEGDKVRSGQVLASLDMATVPQNIILAQADLITAQRNLDSLKQSTTAQAQAQQALVKAQDAYTKAKNHRDGLNYPRASQTNIDNAYTNYQFALSQVATAQDTYDRMVNLPNDNLMKVQALSQLTTAQKNRDQTLATYNWMIGKPTDTDLSQADADLGVAKAQLDDAQREWDRLKNGPDPKDLAAAQVRIDALQATLNSTRISAPFDGTITDLNINPGDIISAASATATSAAPVRVDDLSHLYVDVQVTEVDINRVSIGQPVSMTFDAISNKTYQGKVTQVARVGSAVQGVVYFTVTVEITNPDGEVRPGMTAAANVVVNQLPDVLLVPNRAIRLRDNQRVVYILQNGQPTAVEIKLGATSDTSSELVSSNLKEGDQVILNPPQLIGGGNGGFFTR